MNPQTILMMLQALEIADKMGLNPIKGAQNAVNNATHIGATGYDPSAEQSSDPYGEDIEKFLKHVMGDNPSLVDVNGKGLTERLAAIVNGTADPDLPTTTSTINSDRFIKDLSPEHKKAYISALVHNKKKLSPKDAKILVESFKVKGYDPKDKHLWKDSVLNDYAKYVKNFAYTYNDEAKKLDPGTDTAKEHIGPMAQDIEKVNPAAVVTDENTGYKSVDTGRLALMNAGAIAELARELKGIKSRSIADGR